MLRNEHCQILVLNERRNWLCLRCKEVAKENYQAKSIVHGKQLNSTKNASEMRKGCASQDIALHALGEIREDLKFQK